MPMSSSELSHSIASRIWTPSEASIVSAVEVTYDISVKIELCMADFLS